MKNLKKLSALVLTLVMALSLCVNAGALDANVKYLSPAPDTEYTTVTNASSVTLEVLFSAASTPTNWYSVGFDTTNQADSVTWSVVRDNANLIAGTVAASHSAEGDMITATGTVNLTSNTHGVAIIRASYTDVQEDETVGETYTLDLTICKEATSTVAAVSNVSVEVVDARFDYAGCTNAYDYAYDLTVSAINAVGATHPLYSQTATAKSYPTVLNALWQVVGLSNMAIAEGYVESITVPDMTTGLDVELTAYLTNDWDYVGWNYCVFRDGGIVADGNLMSASILEIETGDSIYWAFGTAAQADAYFSELVA